MAIVNMSKFNLIVQVEDSERLLQPLQKFKYVHFLNLHENQELEALDLSSIDVEETMAAIDKKIRDISFVIDTLAKYDDSKKGLLASREGLVTLNIEELEEKAHAIDFNTLYEQVKTIQVKKETIVQKKQQFDEQIAELKPWVALGAPISWLSDLSQSHVHIGTVPKKLMPRLVAELAETQFSAIQTVSEDHLNAYIILLSHHSENKTAERLLTHNGFSRRKLQGYEKTPEEEISHLTKAQVALHSEAEEVKMELTRLTSQLTDLEILHDYYLLEKTRITASDNFLNTDRFTLLEGYVPTNKQDKFIKVIEKQIGEAYFLTLNEAEEEDRDVPILLKNNKFNRVFESVTTMFALPRYNEIDPTPLFSLFYAFFFGMMVGDAGYGLLTLVVTFIVLRFWKLKESQQGFFHFFYFLSFSTILWGVIYGSFFGHSLPFPALINATEEYSFLLILSIAFGAVHIFVALAINAYMSLRKGKILDAIYDVLFWYMAIGGGIVYLLSFLLPAFNPYEKTALVIMIIGMVGIVLTGGRENKTIGGKLAGGLYSLYGITSYVGDFVSYSRLMALGLSGAFIAFAINLMVDMLFDLGVIGIIVGVIVFIVGQAFNLFLSTLSSYVHTLRLTYVEFFGKFYEGGGKAFKLFRNKSKYIDIK